MLPFLQPKKISSLIVARQGKPNTEVASEMEGPESDDIDPGLESAAEEILRAIETRSSRDLARALQDAFMICDSMPHDEGSEMEDM